MMLSTSYCWYKVTPLAYFMKLMTVRTWLFGSMMHE